MLSGTDIAAVLARVSYKPGWTLEVYDTPAPGAWLLIAADQEDAHHPGQVLPLRMRCELPPFPTESTFLTWLRWRLEAVERHECHEWLRVDGHAPWDPHAEAAVLPDGGQLLADATSLQSMSN
jgi:hypothetical protein